jgi:hypothetical protein
LDGIHAWGFLGLCIVGAFEDILRISDLFGVNCWGQEQENDHDAVEYHAMRVFTLHKLAFTA